MWFYLCNHSVQSESKSFSILPESNVSRIGFLELAWRLNPWMMGRVFPRHDFCVIEIEKYMWMKTVEYLDNLFSVGRRKVAT